MLSLLADKCHNAKMAWCCDCKETRESMGNAMNAAKCIGIALLVAAALAGCGGYSVSLNDRTLHDPAGRLQTGQVADANLQGCINFALLQQRLDDATELAALSCPDSEVRSLEAIGVLPGLRVLNLGDNALSNLTPLEELPLLIALDLSGNAVSDARPLLNLANLASLDLRENDDIPCSQIDSLRVRLGEGLLAPSRCE